MKWGAAIGAVCALGFAQAAVSETEQSGDNTEDIVSQAQLLGPTSLASGPGGGLIGAAFLAGALGGSRGTASSTTTSTGGSN